MKTSSAGIALLESFEGCRLKAYKCLESETYYTIGFGHYGPDVTPGMTITKAQAEALLRTDLARFEKKVDKYMSIYNFNQNQYDALVSFCYNVGNIDGLTARGCRSIAQISEYFTVYNKSGGKVIKGLVDRRAKEKALFDSGMNVVQKNQSSDTSQYPTLKIGSRGQYVKIMQQALNYRGVAGGKLSDDGVFGPITYNAVIEFQALNGLKKDGIVGQKTWGALMKA